LVIHGRRNHSPKYWRRQKFGVNQTYTKNVFGCIRLGEVGGDLPQRCCGASKRKKLQFGGALASQMILRKENGVLADAILAQGDQWGDIQISDPTRASTFQDKRYRKISFLEVGTTNSPVQSSRNGTCC
jgi:hypothetical protein